MQVGNTFTHLFIIGKSSAMQQTRRPAQLRQRARQDHSRYKGETLNTRGQKALNGEDAKAAALGPR